MGSNRSIDRSKKKNGLGGDPPVGILHTGQALVQQAGLDGLGLSLPDLHLRDDLHVVWVEDYLETLLAEPQTDAEADDAARRAGWDDLDD